MEQERCRENVGCQDQTLAAFGGLNYIEFGGSRHLCVTKVTISPETFKSLEDHLMMFFTGFSRKASDIAFHQIQNIPKKKSELNEMYKMTTEAVEILNGKKILNFGKLLHESWKLKRNLSDKITNPHIDELYKTARGAGA
ncbi:MAG TPA: kinase, partial [Candidatus Omnitrophota bacterium]|nr:kinase [Candidatus Omnitrophota bacterium]